VNFNYKRVENYYLIFILNFKINVSFNFPKNLINYMIKINKTQKNRELLFTHIKF